MWDSFVEAIRVSMFVAGQACNGSLGAGILLISLTLRLLLLPLTVRLALRARVNQGKMAALAPELERLREQYASDPMRYWHEVGSVMRAHGVRPADPAAFIGMLIQAPILSSSVALSVGAGAAVSLLQNWLIARGVRSAA